MAVSITICNLALGELRANPIADVNEASLEARECRRYYPHVLKLLLEDPDHSFSFGGFIEQLAQLYDNARSNEWNYAYAKPATAGVVRKLIPNARFLIDGSTIYTNAAPAYADCSLRDIDESVMPASFIDAMAYALAARCAIPIRNDREIKRDMVQQAEVARQRAIADDRNIQGKGGTSMDEEVARIRLGGSLFLMPDYAFAGSSQVFSDDDPGDLAAIIAGSA
jgi:hypothetical protein